MTLREKLIQKLSDPMRIPGACGRTAMYSQDASSQLNSCSDHKPWGYEEVAGKKWSDKLGCFVVEATDVAQLATKFKVSNRQTQRQKHSTAKQGSF